MHKKIIKARIFLSWYVFVLFFCFFPKFLAKLITKVVYGNHRSPPTKNILMLTISQLEIDSRIRKVACALANNGYNVYVVTFLNDISLPQEENPFPGVTFYRLPYTPLGALNWIIQPEFIRFAKKFKCEVIHCNDLTTLLTGWIISKIKNIPLVYDAHEMWTENVEFDCKTKQYVPLKLHKKILATQIEKKIIPDTSMFITVCKTIADEYKRRYKLAKAPFLLQNFPELSLLERSGMKTVREECSLNDKHFVILYQGGIGPARNIENVIRSMKFLPDDCVFVIRGPGIEYFKKEYLALAENAGVASRIFFLPSVRQEQIIEAAAGADVGILMLKNLSLNFYWFYPNKLFEYMLSKLAVAVSDFPEVSAHIKRENCGVTFNPESPESIASAIKTVYDNRTECKEMGIRGYNGIQREYNWGKVSSVFVQEYKKQVL